MGHYLAVAATAWILISLLVGFVWALFAGKKDITPTDEEWEEFQEYMRKWRQGRHR